MSEATQPTTRRVLESKIVQIVGMFYSAGPNNGDCNKLVALCEDGSLWEQWHSNGFANVPTDGLWYQTHPAHGN